MLCLAVVQKGAISPTPKYMSLFLVSDIGNISDFSLLEITKSNNGDHSCILGNYVPNLLLPISSTDFVALPIIIIPTTAGNIIAGTNKKPTLSTANNTITPKTAYYNLFYFSTLALNCDYTAKPVFSVSIFIVLFNLLLIIALNCELLTVDNLQTCILVFHILSSSSVYCL